MDAPPGAATPAEDASSPPTKHDPTAASIPPQAAQQKRMEPLLVSTINKVLKSMQPHIYHDKISELLRPMSPHAFFPDILWSPLGNWIIDQFFLSKSAPPPDYSKIVCLLDLHMVLMVYQEISHSLLVSFPFAVEVAVRFIVNTWLADAGEVVLSLPSSLCDRVQRCIQQGNFAADIFTDLRREIMRRMLTSISPHVQQDEMRKFVNKLKTPARPLFCDLFSHRPTLDSHLSLLFRPQAHPSVHVAACESGSTRIVALVLPYISHEYKEPVTGDTLMHVAVRTGLLNIVTELTSRRFPLNEVNYTGMTPLAECCALGHTQMAAYLLANHAEMHPSAMKAVIAGKHWSTLALLLALGMSIPEESTSEVHTVISQQTNIDLSNCHLKAISSNLSEFKSMTHLDLSHNKIAVLPEWLTNMPLLQNIVLVENPLVYIPALLVKKWRPSGTSSNNIFPGAVTTDPSLGRARAMSLDDSHLWDIRPTNRAGTLAFVFSGEELHIDNRTAEFILHWCGNASFYDSNTAQQQANTFVQMHEYTTSTIVLLCFVLHQLRQVAVKIAATSLLNRRTSLGHSRKTRSRISTSGSSENHSKRTKLVLTPETAALVKLADHLAFIIDLLCMWCFQRPATWLLLRLVASHYSDILSVCPLGLPRVQRAVSKWKAQTPLNATSTPSSCPPFIGNLHDPKSIFEGPPRNSPKLINLSSTIFTILPFCPVDLFRTAHIPPSLLAMAITNQQYQLFCDIPIEEFMLERSTRRRKSPHYHRLIDSNKALTNLVITAILTSPDLGTMLLVMERAIKVAHHCYALRNWFGMTGLLSGMQAYSINRLQMVIRFLPEKAHADMSKMQSILSYDRNFANYRGMRGKLRSPSIPLLFPEVRDLIYLEEQPTWKDKVVNFVKLQSILSTLEFMQTCRVEAIAVRYESHVERMDILERIVGDMFNEDSYFLDEDDAYRLSCSLEPTNKDNEHVSRVLQYESTLMKMGSILNTSQQEAKSLRSAICLRSDGEKHLAAARDHMGRLHRLIKNCNSQLGQLEIADLNCSDSSANLDAPLRARSQSAGHTMMKLVRPLRSMTASPKIQSNSSSNEYPPSLLAESLPVPCPTGRNSEPTVVVNPVFNRKSSLHDRLGRST